jgi:hypothetical protein
MEATTHHHKHESTLISKVSVILCLLIQLSCLSSAVAQEVPDSNLKSRELLRPIEGWKRNFLMERHVYEMAILEYFARPGTFDLYNFDVSVLELENETITITPKNSDPIEILSHGIDVNWQYGGGTAEWRGELPIPKSKRTLPAKMHLAIRAVNRFGELRRPDPNRNVTRSAIERESYVVLRESKQRLDERIVYGLINGFIQVPVRMTTLRLSQLGEDLHSFGSVLVYEVDDDKLIIPGDDSPVNPMPPTPDMIRRSKAFKDHEDRVRRRFGLPPKNEY